MVDINQLWKKFKDENDQQARETLIVHYAWLVNFVVARLSIYLPPSLEKGDLIGFGTLGLIEATDRFNLAQGVKFETYATTRIRGQIIDSLRSLNFLPRSAHKRSRLIENSMAQLTQTLGRMPSAEEVAADLQITLKQYYNWLSQATHSIVSLDKVSTQDSGETLTLYDSLMDDSPSPAEVLTDKETKKYLIQAIGQLSKREQLLLSLYYHDGLTMKEIGEVLGVSESRVSQIHSHAIMLLRQAMQESTQIPLQMDYMPALAMA